MTQDFADEEHGKAAVVADNPVGVRSGHDQAERSGDDARLGPNALGEGNMKAGTHRGLGVRHQTAGVTADEVGPLLLWEQGDL